MSGMFSQSHFNGDVSGWDVSHVENMNSMFEKSKFNGNIDGWNVVRVKYIRDMFLDSDFERTGKAKLWLNRAYPELLERARNFDGCIVALNREHLINLIDAAMWTSGPNCDLNFIDVSNVTMMFDLFKCSSFNGNIDNWDVSNVKNMDNMFDGSELEKMGRIPKWYVEKQQRGC
jgi:surface protein